MSTTAPPTPIPARWSRGYLGLLCFLAADAAFLLTLLTSAIYLRYFGLQSDEYLQRTIGQLAQVTWWLHGLHVIAGVFLTIALRHRDPAWKLAKLFWLYTGCDILLTLFIFYAVRP